MSTVKFHLEEAKFGSVGIITLNRPEKLNAIDAKMLQDIFQQFVSWEMDDNVCCIILQSNLPKAFCAGGDLSELVSHRDNPQELLKFFHNEYLLNEYLSRYKKPIIALLNGYTMGGGVGLGMHVSHPIALEDFTFAMPETQIGLFPDVGGKIILHKMPEDIAMYYALSGDKIDIEKAIQYGLVNYAIKSKSIIDFKKELYAKESIASALEYLEKYYVTPTKVNASYPELIGDNLKDIFNSLRTSQEGQRTLASFEKCSPTSLAITFTAMQLAQNQDVRSCLMTDYRIINRILSEGDFFEGIRARIIDKDNYPKWKYISIFDIPDDEILAYFMPIPEELDFI